MRVWLFCVALTACGGIIDTGDGGSGGVDGGPGGSDGGIVKKDANVNDVSVTPSCSPIQTATMLYDGGCQSSASWTCGATKYSVQCNCPSAQCTCSQESNGMGSGTVLQEPSFCPTCNGAEMPKICGFPTN